MIAIGTATYGRPRVWQDLTVPEPPVSICSVRCTCPHHWPQVDPWPHAPLTPPTRLLRGAK